MSADEIHVGDKGTQFTVTLYDGTSVVDLSAATNISLEFKLPTGTVATSTGTITGSGTAGMFSFTVDTSTTWAVDGKWRMQAVVSFSSSKFRSDIYEFRVFPNLS